MTNDFDCIYSVAALAEYLRRIRHDNDVFQPRRKVVCVSGFFNPLGCHHLDYFAAADRLGCPYLVAIVNNDKQVALKGSCPFLPEEERLRLVAACSWIDAAVLSIDQDRSVSCTLGLLKPDVFANGGDVTDCAERELCERLGIKLEFGVGGPKTGSSSKLIEQAAAWFAEKHN